MTSVWIVEYRENHEGVVAHVASTKEKAIKFVENNGEDYGGEDSLWYIDENIVDDDSLLDSIRNGFFCDSSGHILNEVELIHD